MQPVITSPAAGVRFTHLPDDRFTTSRLTVTLYAPLAEDTASVCALIPYLLRRGCAEYPEYTSFRRRLNSLYGAHLVSNVQRVGETQLLTLGISCLDDRLALHGEAIGAECARLLTAMLFDPPLENGLFRADDVAQEQRCLAEALAAEINEKRTYARSQCERLLCAGEPYAIHGYGDEAHIAALTPQAATAMWKKLLREAPAQVVYQGNGDAAAIFAPFAEKLNARPDSNPFAIVENAAKPVVARAEECLDVTQSKLVMGYRSPIYGNHPLTDALRLASVVLGGTPSSLLFTNVREKQSLCYYCLSSYDPRKGVMLIDSGVQPENTDRAEAAITEQLKALSDGAFSEEQLSAARLIMSSACRSLDDSAETLGYWYISQMHRPQPRTPQQQLERFGKITREQVIEAAQTLSPDCVFLLKPDREAAE